MIYIFFILLSLISVYLFVILEKSSSKNIINGTVKEINNNFILVESNNKTFFIQLTKETDYNNLAKRKIKTGSKIAIEHTDIIATSTYQQTFGKKIYIIS